MNTSLKFLKVLIADNADIDRKIIEKALKAIDHEVVYARDAAEVLEQFQNSCPDIVIMDVDTPEINGFEVAAKIRKLQESSVAPVIFLTGEKNDRALATGIENGGDDYVFKPISYVVLEAKVKALGRHIALQQQLIKKTKELERYYHETEDEKRIALHLIERLVSTGKLKDASLKHWFSPAQYFSGDLIAAARTPENDFHVLLADGTGHGLAAALNIIPICQPFYAMTEKGFSIDRIAEELNRKVKHLLPNDRFVATTLVSVDFKKQIIQIWNGGNPPALIMSMSGEVARSANSRHLPLGVLASEDFSSELEIYSYKEPCQLFLFSDGVTEAENSRGQQYSYRRLVDVLSMTPLEERFNVLVKSLSDHLEGYPAHDDISLAEINCVTTEQPAMALAEG